MPSDIPNITDDTPGTAIVYIENPADGSVGECTVDAFRTVYGPSKWKLASRDAYDAHQAALHAERIELEKQPNIVLAPNGESAVAAARRSAKSPES